MSPELLPLASPLSVALEVAVDVRNSAAIDLKLLGCAFRISDLPGSLDKVGYDVVWTGLCRVELPPVPASSSRCIMSSCRSIMYAESGLAAFQNRLREFRVNRMLRAYVSEIILQLAHRGDQSRNLQQLRLYRLTV